MKHFVRALVNKDTRKVDHIEVSDTPLNADALGIVPDNMSSYVVRDYELDTEDAEPDDEAQRDTRFVRAAVLIKNVEIETDTLELKMQENNMVNAAITRKPRTIVDPSSHEARR